MRFVVEKPIFKAFAVVVACAALVVAMQAHLAGARGDLTCLHPRWALLPKIRSGSPRRLFGQLRRRPSLD